MNTPEAAAMARQLMNDHGLKGWVLKFDNAKQRAGQCRYGTKTISLSLPLTALNGVETVRNTVLHEIAHALTQGAGHGPVWRAKAVSIGCNGRRCYGAEKITPPPTFIGTCPGCNATITGFKRRRGACRACCRGTYKPEYAFVWRRNNVTNLSRVSA